MSSYTIELFLHVSEPLASLPASASGGGRISSWPHPFPLHEMERMRWEERRANL